MNPKFAVLQRLCSDKMENEIEIGFSKMRYEVERRAKMKKIEECEIEESNGKRRKVETDTDSKENLLDEAKERQVYDPLEKTLDMSKKRVTDLQECAEIVLPKPRNEKVECEMEIIRNIIMEEFEAYKTDRKGNQKQE